MKNTIILTILLMLCLSVNMTSCAKIKDQNNSHSRMLLFRINNEGNFQTSSDGSTWISEGSEKTKNIWIDVLSVIRQNFRPK